MTEKLFNQIVAYYNAYKSAKENNDLPTQDFLEFKVEKLLIELVCEFETQEMFDYEYALRHYGIHKGAGDEDRVSDILGDVKKLMDGE